MTKLLKNWKRRKKLRRTGRRPSPYSGQLCSYRKVSCGSKRTVKELNFLQRSRDDYLPQLKEKVPRLHRVRSHAKLECGAYEWDECHGQQQARSLQNNWRVEWKFPFCFYIVHAVSFLRLAKMDKIIYGYISKKRVLRETFLESINVAECQTFADFKTSIETYFSQGGKRRKLIHVILL